MSNHASESSLPVLSHADGFAASASDALLLVGRVLLGWLFLTSSWGKFMNMGGYVAYLTNLKVPNPGFFSWIGAPVEFLIGLTLILGFAPAMPPWCVSSSSSSPPRSPTAIGNIRPPKWRPSTTTSSKILRSSAVPWCCS